MPSSTILSGHTSVFLTVTLEVPSYFTDGGSPVARKTVLISDLTGIEINEKEAAKVTITYADARRGQVVLDVNASEVDDLASKGVKQARRGRKPQSTN